MAETTVRSDRWRIPPLGSVPYPIAAPCDSRLAHATGSNSWGWRMVGRFLAVVLALATLPAAATEHLYRIGYHEAPAVHVDTVTATPSVYNHAALVFRYFQFAPFATGPGVLYLVADGSPANTIRDGVVGATVPGGGPHWQYGIFNDSAGALAVGSPFAGGNALQLDASIALYDAPGDGVQQISFQLDLRHRSFSGPPITVIINLFDSRTGYVPPDHIGNDGWIDFVSGSILGGKYSTRLGGDHHNTAWGGPQWFATRILYSQAQAIIRDMGLSYLGPPEQWLLTAAYISGEKAAQTTALAAQDGEMHVAITQFDVWSVGAGR